MNVLVANVHNVIDWDTYENDYTCGLNDAEFPTKQVDHAHQAQHNATDWENCHEADIEVFGCH